MTNITRTQVNETLLVHVDRTPGDKRGRVATIFVDFASQGAAELRQTANSFLLPGEFAQTGSCGKTGADDTPNRMEYAIFA